ncbi:WbuC family cupin fold metalloprotein [Salidesulfovibrio brasiliensis]|uniref:WbuC family cupin fold metalloprotein n=1 Tax=Salidesulfovibrio brasiliensis TaxID=221711 RepID=UPI0006D17B12|nr:WbuC family cupin fold metalloprotein [Salidesulfovibrio brasiliensis]
MSKPAFPMALDAPEGNVSKLDRAMLDTALDVSRRSPRGRVIQPLHKDADATLHRMLNCLQPGTYIRPHRHLDPPKAECFVLLSGAVRQLLFDDEGTVTDSFVIRAGSEVFGADIEPGVWHTWIVLEPDTVAFEVKPGPYTKATDKDFAPWAPEEGTEEANIFIETASYIV